MDLTSFHLHLLCTPPSPEAQKLYASGLHGFSNALKNELLFEATFVLGLYRTKGETPQKVSLAVPLPLESWVIEQINAILRKIQRERRQRFPKGPQRTEGNRRIAQAVACLEMGSRVQALGKEPVRWAAFGFEKGPQLPEWLDKGLL